VLKKRFFQMILLGIKQVRMPYYQGLAAQLAFYFLLSVVPAVIVISQIMGFFAVSLEVLDELILEYVYSEAVELFRGLITQAPSRPLNIAFIIIALWSASKAQFSMIRIMNLTITDGQVMGTGFFRDRLKALKIILFTLFAITFALVILVYGEMLLRLFFDPVNRALQIEYEVDMLLMFLRWPIALLLYFFMVSYSYYALPYKKVGFKEILPGSLFASISMLIVTFLYSLYMTYVANFDIIYGSLATAVSLMFWFFFLSWALVLGMVFNKVFHETKKPQQTFDDEESVEEAVASPAE
jgi:membrane protein